MHYLPNYTDHHADLIEHNTKNEKYILYFGSLKPESGIENLIKAWSRIAKQHQVWHLKIVGSSKIPWQGKSLKNLQRLYPALELEIN